MFYIVETENSVNELFDSLKEDSSIYLDVIQFHDYYHPKLQSVCCVYIRPLNSHKGYIIPISHSEALTIKLSYVSTRLSNLSKEQIYSINGKFIKYFFRNLEVLDVSYYASINNQDIDIEYTTTSIKTNFYKKYKKNEKVYFK